MAIDDDAMLAWQKCRNDNDIDECDTFCQTASEITPDDWVRKACKWVEAENLNEEIIYLDNCEVEGDLDWCEFACIEAINGNDWYYNSEVVFACDASGYEGNYDEFKTDDDDQEFVSFKRIHEANYDAKRVAEVSLADKDVAVENSSSNSGYYIAGVSLLSAATVVYIVS